MILSASSIVDLIGDSIKNMDLTIRVDSSVDNGDGTFTINTCDTNYLTECSVFVVGTSDYVVTGYESNTSVTIMGSPILDSDFELSSPLFIPDTPIGANTELSLRNTEIDRHPFIWLVDNFDVDIDTGNSLNQSESRVKLFFLTVSNNAKWLHGDHRSNCIRPMEALASKLVNQLELDFAGKIDNVSIKSLPRFGVYVNNQGNKKTILDESLSGVGIDVLIPIRKWALSCKKCN